MFFQNAKPLCFLIATILFSTIQADAPIKGLVQTTTVIGGTPFYFPLGPSSRTLRAGGTTAAPSYQVATTPAASQPTLVYNCAQMAAICNNVASWLSATGNTLPRQFIYDRTGTTDFQALRDKLEDKLLPGKVGKKKLDFGKMRRAQMCDATSGPNVFKSRTCPEPNQPALIQSRFKVDWDIIDVIKDAQNNPTKLIEGRKNANGQYTEKSGMRYTCDEFPPASWVEGGAGPDGTDRGTVYCAPQSNSCGSSAADKKLAGFIDLKGQDPLHAHNADPVSEATEQDFQGKTHGILNLALGNVYPNNPAYAAFQFTTLAAPNIVPFRSRAWVIIPTTIAGVASTQTNAKFIKRTDHDLFGLPRDYIRYEARGSDEDIAKLSALNKYFSFPTPTAGPVYGERQMRNAPQKLENMPRRPRTLDPPITAEGSDMNIEERFTNLTYVTLLDEEESGVGIVLVQRDSGSNFEVPKRLFMFGIFLVVFLVVCTI